MDTEYTGLFPIAIYSDEYDDLCYRLGRKPRIADVQKNVFTVYLTWKEMKDGADFLHHLNIAEGDVAEV